MSDKLILGSFDAETYWVNNNNARLPGFTDQEADQAVLAMDELLFLSCDSSDTLITRFPMAKIQREYLELLGFEFKSNQEAVCLPKEGLYEKQQDIFQCLTRTENQACFKKLIDKNLVITPFSSTPNVFAFAKTYGLKTEYLIDDSIIYKTNRKLYSTQLNQCMFPDYRGVIVHSSEELQSKAKEYLAQTSILIKADFGVSGKGNLLIDSEKKLKSIVRYISKQEQAGKLVDFIIEEYLDKKTDFSCQFFIENDGTFRLLSVQLIENQNFTYHGSFAATNEFMTFLTEKGYFETMQNVAKKLYAEGYHGHVCIDSMVLKDDRLVEIVEINARMSMSLLKSYMDRYLRENGQTGYMTYLSMKIPVNLTYEQFLIALREDGLLYQVGKENGIIPLTPNAMFVNTWQETSKEKVYGRLYFGVVGKEDCLDQFKRFAEKLSIELI